MNGLRDITQQCGQPTALSQLSTNITGANPAVLADASVYKQAPQTNMNNPMEVHNIPTSSNLMHEFNQRQQKGPMPIPLPPPQMVQKPIQPPQQQMTSKQEQNFQTKASLPPHQMAMQQHHQLPPQMMMQMQQMMIPQMMMQMPQMMYPNMMQQRPQQQIPQQPKQQQEPKKKDEINTNGTSDMKDEKEVENELDSLRPTYKDVNQINQLLDDTKNDDKMQNSQFMNFLRNLKNKPAIPDEQKMDESQVWANQFKGWNDPNDIDNMNWQSYMEAIDPTKSNDPQYEFAKENHYLEENKNNDSNMDHFAEGKRLMKEGNLNEAILAFESCIKAEPNRSEAWRYLGICHADNENENGAIAAYLKCNNLDPYDLDALLQLGVSYTNEIDPFRALNYLKQWIGNHPDYAVLAEDELKTAEPKINPNNMMGGWSGSREQHKKVVNMFNKALVINNVDADLHIVLGVLYNITSEFDIAENHFKKAIQSRPTDPSLWNKLGATQANGGRCKNAISAYSKALQLKPNYVRALSNLGISFANQDMHKEACQSYLASLKLNPSADTVWDHLTMSLMHLNRGDLVELCKHKDVKYFKNHFDF